MAIRVNFPWSSPSISRKPGETDNELRERVEGIKHRDRLRHVLYKLGVKSAAGRDPAWVGGPIFKPGVYSNVRVDAPDHVQT